MGPTHLRYGLILVAIPLLGGCVNQAICDADGDGLCPPLDCDDQDAAIGDDCYQASPTPSPTPTATDLPQIEPVSIRALPHKIVAAQAREGLGSALAVVPGINNQPDGLLIGAYTHQMVPGLPNTGGAYLIPGPIDGALDLAELAAHEPGGIVFEGGRENGAAGWSVEVGDITCDGIPDYLIGEPGPFSAEIFGFKGAVHIVPGPQPPGVYTLGEGSLRIEARELGTRFGFSMAILGDINNDGCDDLVVGAPYAEAGGAVDRGEAYLFYGPITEDKTDNDADVLFLGEGADERAGWTVKGGGDLNGDGKVDIVIGALDHRDGIHPNTGAAYVIFSTPGPIFDLGMAEKDGRGLKLLGQSAGDQAARSIAPAGDYNGDGYPDIVIGSARNDAQADQSGAAYVILPQTKEGVLSGLQSLGDLVAGERGYKLSGVSSGDHAGWSVQGAGDVNGDGLDDLLIAAPHESTMANDAGMVYLMPGQVDSGSYYRYLDNARGIFSGERDYDSAGYTMAGPIDLNGDGLMDLVFSALTDRESPSSQQEFLRWTGEIYIVYGERKP